MEGDADEDCVVRVLADGKNYPLQIKCVTWTPPVEIAENIRFNIQRTTPRLLARQGLAIVKDEPIAIVGGGPSLRKTLSELRDFKHILSVSSTHDYLVDNGIIPNYCAVADSIESMKDCIRKPQKDCVYAIASQCHPSMFDALADYKVEMWHFRGQLQDADEEAKVLGGETAICCGCTTGLNAIYLAILFGHQHLHFFGFDSCYADGLTHSYGMADERPTTWTTVKSESGREFITDTGMLAQAEQFYKIIAHNCRWFRTYIHGDGLIAEMARTGNDALKQAVTVVNTDKVPESYPQINLAVAS